jgi:prepilin-type N-terminal cleavage/methylation domain-containing protein
MKKSAGFTLIELVMVIAIIGILASLSVPKFLDLSGAAKQSATKAGLGSLRSVLAIRYASSATGGATASYPTMLAASDFAGGDLPRNSLSNFSGVTALSVTTTGTATHASVGFWFVSRTNAGTPAGADYGKGGAYSDGTTDTSGF